MGVPLWLLVAGANVATNLIKDAINGPPTASATIYGAWFTACVEGNSETCCAFWESIEGDPNALRDLQTRGVKKRGYCNNPPPNTPQPGAVNITQTFNNHTSNTTNITNNTDVPNRRILLNVAGSKDCTKDNYTVA